jgi:hypothetical protein
MRLAVEQLRQRLPAQRPGNEIGDAPPGVADAARPAPRVAGASFGEPPARVAREAKRDQDQVAEIPGYRFLEAGQSRTDQVNRQTMSGMRDIPAAQLRERARKL